MVEWLFLAVTRGCLRFVIVVFPDHIHLLFLTMACHCLLINTEFNVHHSYAGGSLLIGSRSPDHWKQGILLERRLYCCID